MKIVREGENYFQSALMAVNRKTIKKCNNTQYFDSSVKTHFDFLNE